MGKENFERLVVLLPPELKREAEIVSEKLGLSLSRLFRALYERPDVYGKLILEERKKLKGGQK